MTFFEQKKYEKNQRKVAVFKVKTIILKFIFCVLSGVCWFFWWKNEHKKNYFWDFPQKYIKKSKKLDFWRFLVTNLKKYFFRFFRFYAKERKFFHFFSIFCKKTTLWSFLVTNFSLFFSFIFDYWNQFFRTKKNHF